VSEQLQQADEWIGTISLLETERRLAKLLIIFYEKNNQEKVIKLPAQKKELAAWLGTTPETLSRKLAYFEECGLIANQRGNISILKPEELREVVNGLAAVQ
jgi:CRP-like cAMP-binding protein